MKRVIFLVLTCLGVIVTGCAGYKSSRGFSLPDGDPKKGEAAFVELQCYACHKVHGVDFPESDEQQGSLVMLGGEVARLKTYGELVTSIINPSHRIARGYKKDTVELDGQSKMNSYNDVLTVSQLIDLVAFLESHYELEVYEPTDYHTFP